MKCLLCLPSLFYSMEKLRHLHRSYLENMLYNLGTGACWSIHLILYEYFYLLVQLSFYVGWFCCIFIRGEKMKNMSMQRFQVVDGTIWPQFFLFSPLERVSVQITRLDDDGDKNHVLSSILPNLWHRLSHLYLCTYFFELRFQHVDTHTILYII